MPELRDKAERQTDQADGFERLDQWMADPKFQEHLRALLPQHMNPLRFMTITMRIVREVPRLVECHPMDICLATLQAATLGLEIAVNGECWIIPYFETVEVDGRREKMLIPQLQIGYLGHLALAYRSEKIAAVQCDVVMPGDAFDFQRGTDGFLHHKPERDREIGPELTHVWAMVETIYGGKIWNVLTKGDLERIRSASKSPNSPAWSNWYPEQGMAKVLKRTLKWAPKSREAARAITLDDESDAGVRQSFGAVFPQLDARTPVPPDRQRAQDVVDEAVKATAERQADGEQRAEGEQAAERREPEPAKRTAAAAAQPEQRREAPAAEEKPSPKGTLGW